MKAHEFGAETKKSYGVNFFLFFFFEINREGCTFAVKQFYTYYY